jgi:hypothetical protein
MVLGGITTTGSAGVTSISAFGGAAGLGGDAQEAKRHRVKTIDHRAVNGRKRCDHFRSKAKTNGTLKSHAKDWPIQRQI